MTQPAAIRSRRDGEATGPARSSAWKVATAVAPGVLATGATAVANTGVVIAGAPLFAMAGLGTAAVIMGAYARADRRRQR